MNVSLISGGTVKIEQTVLSLYPSTSNFTGGSSVHLEAIPASGYRFDNWSGDVSSSNNSITVIMSCNKDIVANFSHIVHTLTMQVSGSGSTTPDRGIHSYNEGTVVNITANADGGWQFDSWTGDVTGLYLANTTLTIYSDTIVTANFSQTKPRWSLIVGIITSAIIIGIAIWWALRWRARLT